MINKIKIIFIVIFYSIIEINYCEINIKITPKNELIKIINEFCKNNKYSEKKYYETIENCKKYGALALCTEHDPKKLSCKDKIIYNQHLTICKNRFGINNEEACNTLFKQAAYKILYQKSLVFKFKNYTKNIINNIFSIKINKKYFIKLVPKISN